jgi:hypothetical protein
VNAQSLPSSIRGYKVREADVEIVASGDPTSPKSPNNALVNLSDPELVDLGLSGATIEMGAEIRSGGQSGRVDFLTFRDFRVGGIPVEIDEYAHPFSFKKGQLMSIPKPIRVSFSVFNVSKAVYRELTEQRDELQVTGTVFVFGKFKKMGFEFKRVIPVKIDLKIKNPLRQA